jgi:predicted ATPase
VLKRLYVDNYRCLVNFTLDLQELTLLVGRNGSGKSSVLDVLYALRQLLSGVAKVTDPNVFPTASLTRWQTGKLQVFEVTTEMDDEADLIYRVEVEHEKETRRARIRLESLRADDRPLFEFSMGEVHLFRDDHSSGPVYGADWSESAMARVAPRNDNQRLTRFLEFMRGVSVCALNPKSFVAESLSEDPVLEVDGGNLASWYRHQIQERPDRMHSVVEVLRTVIEGFDTLRTERVGSEARVLTVAFASEDGRYELRLDELSDGQRALIALYALVHLAGDQDVLFLDEPDNYLALTEIQPWLIALSDASGVRPRQAILCSHHPELLDYLGAEAGMLLQREASGGVIVRPLQQAIGQQTDSGLRISEIVARGWEL